MKETHNQCDMETQSIIDVAMKTAFEERRA
jgi:hypothetical protein